MSAMGIIFASDKEVKLNELTIHRTTASLPFGGRYRLIDFALSNFVNSGITKIGIIARNNYNSLMDHIRMGRDWDLNRKNSGIAVLPPFVHSTSSQVYKGKIEALYSNINFLRNSDDEYVFLVNGNVAANIDFEKAIKKYEKANADILVFTANMNYANSRRVSVKTDSQDFITDVLIMDSFSGAERVVGLNCYLIKKELLLSLIEEAYARSRVDFEKDILQANVGKLKLLSYHLDDYVAVIDDVKSYYYSSMRLLDKKVRDDLFKRNGDIFTKVKDSSPTTYGKEAKLVNSLVADGCVIEGTVENSILFRGVKVEKGAYIKNSIVMEDGYIGEDAKLAYVITDKDVTVSAKRSLSGFETYPIVIVKGKTV